MHWIRPFGSRSKWLTAFALAVLFLVSVRYSPLSSSEEKKLSVYAPQGTYTLLVSDHDKTEYAGLYELLQPLGSLQLKIDGPTFRLRVNNVEGEFTEGKTKIRIGRWQLQLPARVVIDRGRVLLPVHEFPAVLAQYLGLHADFHETGRRLFIENTSSLFSTDLKRPDEVLVLRFPAPVNPTVNTESGRVHLLFTREPVVFGADSVTYSDKLINNLSFVEHNGTAEIIVSGSSPLLATFSDGAKTITISAAPAPVTASNPASPDMGAIAQNASANAPISANASTPAKPEINARRSTPADGSVHFFVMIDPGHGGEETGARFTDKLSEKDITLAIARRLRTELQNRGVGAVLLRDGDSGLTLDQRAVATNAQRPGLYIAIHAGALGTGVRVYTALLPAAASDRKTREKEATYGPFVPWEMAQTGFVERSRMLAGLLVTEMGNKDINCGTATAPVPPLNSVATPALAIEIAPPVFKPVPEGLTTVTYQQAIAVAAATAIANARPRLEESR